MSEGDVTRHVMPDGRVRIWRRYVEVGKIAEDGQFIALACYFEPLMGAFMAKMGDAIQGPEGERWAYRHVQTSYYAQGAGDE